MVVATVFSGSTCEEEAEDKNETEVVLSRLLVLTEDRDPSSGVGGADTITMSTIGFESEAQGSHHCMPQKQPHIAHILPCALWAVTIRALI